MHLSLTLSCTGTSLCQTADVVADGILIVRGTGTDNDQEFIALSGQDVPDLGVSLCLDPGMFCRERMLLPDFIRGRQLLYKFKTHDIFSPFLLYIVQSQTAILL